MLPSMWHEVAVPADAIRDWLSEYKSLAENQLHTFAEVQRANDDLVGSLHDLFDSLNDDLLILEPICHQLFDFYRSSEINLKRFTLELLPNLMAYTLQTHNHFTKAGAAVEACLLGIYNLEIVHCDGESKVTSFRIPSLGQPSVYHEPVKISTLALTETALSKFANKDTEVWTGGPHQQYDVINIQNREAVLTLLQQAYNADIANLSLWSREAFCHTCVKIAGAGFQKFAKHILPAHSSSTDHPKRISVSAGLLVEMLSGIYYCMYNGHMKMASLAIEAIHSRACYELYSDVQLVTNAIRNSLVNSTTDDDDPMGIAISVMSTSSVLKTALTNASFRAHKLPDDIPISVKQGTALPSIDEKGQGQIPMVSVTLPTSSPRMLKFSKIVGRKTDKTKTKKDQDASSNMNTNNIEGTDPQSMPVVVNKKHTKTTVDNIELTSLNPPDYNTNNSNSNEEILTKPRSSSLTTTSTIPIGRQMVTRYSSHNINPMSTHTQI